MSKENPRDHSNKQKDTIPDNPRGKPRMEPHQRKWNLEDELDANDDGYDEYPYWRFDQ